MIEHTNLILRAHEAPHECSDPQCPGNRNRRKLAAFDGLLAVAKRAGGMCVCKWAAQRDVPCLPCMAKAAIAKAQE